MSDINTFLNAIFIGMGFTIGALTVIGWTWLILKWLHPAQAISKLYF